MATYNGGRYLRQQIDSLLAQTVGGWQLYVADDGSTDETMDILADYACRHGNIHVARNMPPHGAMQNFMHLLATTSADYYMFCDQDDVWLPDKVEVTMGAMRRAEEQWPGEPVLVHTDLRVVDEQLHELHPSLWRETYVRPELLSQMRYLGVQPFVTGCTAMVNASLRNVALPCPQWALMHDAWLAMQAVRRGGHIVNVAQPTMLYRQHGDNVVGATSARNHGWRQRITTLRRLWADNCRLYDFARRCGYGSPLKYAFFKLRYHFLARRGQ